MEKLNIFATQMKTRWYKNFIEQAKNNLGHKDLSWPVRAMIAFENAGMEGCTFTANEMEDALAPYIGRPEGRHVMNNMAVQAIRRGIMNRTGRKKRVEGVRNPYPEYEIVGHIEIHPDSGAVVPVRMRE